MKFQKGHPFYKGGEKQGFKKGHIPWDKGIPCSEKRKQNISKAKIGKSVNNKRNISEETKQIWIKNLYKNGKSPWLGRTLTEEHRRKCGEWQIGEKSPKWKGGKHKSQSGYIHIYNPKHPLANGKYVFEHRLVMEKTIGRYLLPKEKVHHINGVRDDNRPENLMLVIQNPHYGKIKCPFCSKDFLLR